MENLSLRFDLLEKYKSDHIDIIVHPWCDLSMINSSIPEPKAKTRALMLNGLIDIYESWKRQLDDSGLPYYLKIWLYEPRFSRSQVVCARGNKIEHYENAFFMPDESTELRIGNYGSLRSRLQNFTWDHCLDEDHYDNSEVGEPENYATRQDYIDTKKWFEKIMKKPHRITRFKEPVGEITEMYSFKRGNVWIGELK